MIDGRRQAERGAAIAATRYAETEARATRRRYRPFIAPPAPQGFIAAVIH
jgi:hypothetical protein